MATWNGMEYWNLLENMNKDSGTQYGVNDLENTFYFYL